MLNVLRPVIASPITKEIAKGVLSTGMKIGSDVITGQKSFKESVGSNLEVAKKKVEKTLLENLKKRQAEEKNSSDEVGDEEFTVLGLPNRPKTGQGLKRKKVVFNPRSKRRKIIDF